MHRSLLVILCSALFIAGIACTEEAVTSTDGLVFTEGQKTEYNYITKKTATQYINDDEVSIKSEIAWQFALRCLSSNEQEAQLRLTIQVIRASVDGPQFKHQIDSSLKEAQSQVPVIGHLVLLNGCSFEMTYDYKQQQLSAVRGLENLHQAFRKKYPKDEFTEEEHPAFERIKQEYSNQAILRLWREILRSPGSGSESFKLDAPLSITVQRQWNDDSYTLSATDLKDHAKLVTLTHGPNPIQARINVIEGKGRILIKDRRLQQATGSYSVKMDYNALTQPTKQDLTVEWAMIELKR